MTRIARASANPVARGALSQRSVPRMAHRPIGENFRKCYSPQHGDLYRFIRGLGRHPPFG